jgi:uncharacterized protein (TIRG00374 family)
MTRAGGPRTSGGGEQRPEADDEGLVTRPPEQTVDQPPPGNQFDDRGLEFSGRTVLTLAGFLAAAILALYLLLPQLAGLEDTWERIEDGSPAWIAFALLLTVGMFAGYVTMFLGVFGAGHRISWRESYLITMAGLAASRLFAAGGAGGLVLQAWALRQAGMEPRRVADKTISFLVLTYMPYAAAVVLCGVGLRIGLLPGEAPFTMTVIPAIIAFILMLLTSLILLVPTDLQRRLTGFAERAGRLGRVAQRLALLPATTSAGLHDALERLRRRDPGLIGAVLYWAFQIAVLWAAFHAFGDPPPTAVLIQAFFVGMLGNLLPIPGGVGGVEGGMIGSFAAFGTDAGLAVVAVLVYRAFTFWLPLVPGVIAFFRLRTTVDRWRRERGATIQSKA